MPNPPASAPLVYLLKAPLPDTEARASGLLWTHRIICTWRHTTTAPSTNILWRELFSASLQAIFPTHLMVLQSTLLEMCLWVVSPRVGPHRAMLGVRASTK